MHSSRQHISTLLYNIGYMWPMCLEVVLEIWMAAYHES
jgi:hypothetical protein